jgi:hypothetical protein
MSDDEFRVTRHRVEVRSNGKSSRTIGGYAAVFGQRSEMLPGGFEERVLPSFFNKSAGDGFPGVVARYEHNPDFLLGSTAGGTLDLRIDKRGLDYSVVLPECRSDVLELVSRGDVPFSSFSFNCFDDEWTYENGHPQRNLLSGRLRDVAPTATPAYPATSVSLRSLARYMDAPIEDVERYCAEGELRKLFTRTDLPALPVPAQAVQNDIDLRRRVLAHRQRGVAIQCDEDQRGVKPRDNVDLRLRLLESRRLGAEIEAEAEPQLTGWPGYRPGYHQV